MQHTADGYILSMPSRSDGTRRYSEKERAINTELKSKRGGLRARTHRQDNDTPALNALTALRGAPISMGRGESPVELCRQSSVLPTLIQHSGQSLCHKLYGKEF